MGKVGSYAHLRVLFLCNLFSSQPRLSDDFSLLDEGQFDNSMLDTRLRLCRAISLQIKASSWMQGPAANQLAVPYLVKVAYGHVAEHAEDTWQ